MNRPLPEIWWAGPVAKWWEICLSLPERALALGGLLCTQLLNPYTRLPLTSGSFANVLFKHCCQSSFFSNNVILLFSHTSLRLPHTCHSPTWKRGQHQTGILSLSPSQAFFPVTAKELSLFWQRPVTTLASRGSPSCSLILYVSTKTFNY